MISDIEIRIARKFPGNAERAQEELCQAAVEAAKQGKVVVRVSIFVLLCSSAITVLFFTSYENF